MWLAPWVEARGRGDPGAGWRGTYTSALGAARIVKEAGGAIAHMERCLSPLGIVMTFCPRAGDIALVESGGGIVGGLVMGPSRAELDALWAQVACLSAGGVSIKSRPIVAAWRV